LRPNEAGIARSALPVRPTPGGGIVSPYNSLGRLPSEWARAVSEECRIGSVVGGANIVADTFNFARNDKRIVKYLTATEINGVTTWQNISLDYEFEFHTMHTIGNPVYMREKSLGLGSSLPKIDTKDKSTLTIKVVNPERIKNPKCLEDFTKVVKANLPLFQKLAKIYYEGEEIAATGPTTSLLVVFRCTTVSTVKPIYVKVPKAKEFIAATWWANAQRHAGKPTCTLHKNSVCMDKGTMEAVPVKDAIGVGLIFNDNFDVVAG
jgi:hypothetical protein